jgi:integrase
MRRVGHIRERSPGSFELRYSLGADASGKYKVATTTVRGSRKDAERELRRLLRAIDVGEHVGVTRMSVGQWLDRWLDMVRGESSSATHARYEMVVANYLRPAWGGLQLSKITPTHIQDTYAKWAKGGRRDGRAGPLAPSTRRLLHRVLMVALNRAVELQVIARNPATVLRRRLPKLERGEMRTLAPEQIHAVLDGLSGKPQCTPIMLLLATGARRGEVLALRWRHLDLERGTALIVDSISPKLVIGAASPER